MDFIVGFLWITLLSSILLLPIEIWFLYLIVCQSLCVIYCQNHPCGRKGVTVFNKYLEG